MKERPILFSGAMVRALIDGSKTQTRRVIKDPTVGESYSHTLPDGRVHIEWLGTPSCGTGVWDVPEHSAQVVSPYGIVGDRLWVRETFVAFGRWETRFSEKKGRDEWHFVDMTLETGRQYRYDGALPNAQRAGATPTWWKRPSIHIPRAASRITLEVTGVRVERLQDISREDAIAEGIDRLALHSVHWRDYRTSTSECDDYTCLDPRESYQGLWDSLNAARGYGWKANPWVWVVEFKRIES